MLQISTNYTIIPDKNLVALILSGNEEAGIFLIYVKFDKDIDYHVIRYYNNLEYKEDLTNELYIHLKDNNGNWSPLRTFQWRCSLRTWFNSVVSHLFLKKRKELIGIEENSTSIDTSKGRILTERQPNDEERNTKLVMLLEAINRLSNEDYRFILLKEIEGYNAHEIALLLNDKREKENRIRLRKNGETITATPDYIYMLKNRALKEVKNLIKKVQDEWYRDKR